MAWGMASYPTLRAEIFELAFSTEFPDAVKLENCAVMVVVEFKTSRAVTRCIHDVPLVVCLSPMRFVTFKFQFPVMKLLIGPKFSYAQPDAAFGEITNWVLIPAVESDVPKSNASTS